MSCLWSLHQKRIENMQKPSGCNSKEHLLPDQGVPSKVALEAGQQKFSLQYEACSQGVLLDPVFNKQKLEHGSPLKETTIREVTHLQFQEPSTPIQGSLPLVEMKRKTPENFTCSSPQPQQQSYILLNSVHKQSTYCARCAKSLVQMQPISSNTVK